MVFFDKFLTQFAKISILIALNAINFLTKKRPGWVGNENLLQYSSYLLPSKNKIKLILCNAYFFLDRLGFAGCLFKLKSNPVKKCYQKLLVRRYFYGKNVVGLTNLEAVTARPFNKKIAVHVHIYYQDLFDEIFAYLRNIEFDFDLYITTTKENEKLILAKIQKGRLKLCAKFIKVSAVKNIGRDIYPFFFILGTNWKNYDIVAHFHSKKSLYTGQSQDGWRRYLLKSLLGSGQEINKIITILSSEKGGIVFPQTFHNVPCYANTILSNAKWSKTLLAKMKLDDNLPSGYFDYPVGTMFWASTAAIEPLFDLRLTEDDFNLKNNLTDGTIAHAIERLFGLVPRYQGYDVTVLKVKDNPNITSSGIESSCDTYSLLNSCAMKNKLIVFDIFDTLVTRFFLKPEDIKLVIQNKLQDCAVLDHFAAIRTESEEVARKTLNRDVCIDDIYDVMGKKYLLSKETTEYVKKLELKLETLSISKRQEVASLVPQMSLQNRVALASDMFLSKSTISSILNDLNIGCYNDFFLSNEINKRKDCGSMYDFIIQKSAINPVDILMIGDNVVSDVQIPLNKGITVHYLPSNFDVARSFPDMREMIDSQKAATDLAYRTLLGVVVEDVYTIACLATVGETSLFKYNLKNLSFAFAGPLLWAFCAWLIDECRNKGVKKIFFCARDGKIMYDVYMKIKEIYSGPAAEYLLVSRRAVSVPTIEGFDDLKPIATIPFAKASIYMYMYERFGISKQTVMDKLDQVKSYLDDQQLLEVAGPENWDFLVPILRVYFNDILKNAKEERAAIIKYFRAIGADADNVAFVDVGYSGTIQKYISKLLGSQTLGMYMITRNNISVLEDNGNSTLGFLGDKLDPMHPFIAQSFFLEKLLAAKSPQLVCHKKIDACTKPVFRDTTQAEVEQYEKIDEMHESISRFIDKVMLIRREFMPEFEVSKQYVSDIYTLLCEESSKNKLEFSADIFLDDFYVGRGLV